MSFLHITNGDSAAGIIAHSTVPGEVLAWRDPMHHGPFPAGLGLDDLSRMRARYLAGHDADPAEDERGFRQRDEMLRGAARYEGVILWFEHDLLDQLQILQILDWFAAKPGLPRPEVICIDRFPGIEPFRGIGQLDGDQMASLFEGRRPVSPAMLALAKAGWAAFRSADPRDLAAFVEGDLAEMPFLRAALLRHIEEYPSTRNGLSRTEEQILSLAADGVGDPVALFVQNMARETALFMGDWRTFSIIDALCRTGLLICETGHFRHPPGVSPRDPTFRAQRLALSTTGRQVLDGKVDASPLMARDEWLGGVHLGPGQPDWRWDGAALIEARN
ncbi:hypothetical protein KHP62_10085 [Rhodobacteraceae bacterium NNCM2]|nr:hypothetical protein [Coraliihabitans acroporae]